MFDSVLNELGVRGMRDWHFVDIFIFRALVLLLFLRRRDSFDQTKVAKLKIKKKRRCGKEGLEEIRNKDIRLLRACICLFDACTHEEITQWRAICVIATAIRCVSGDICVYACASASSWDVVVCLLRNDGSIASKVPFEIGKKWFTDLLYTKAIVHNVAWAIYCYYFILSIFTCEYSKKVRAEGIKCELNWLSKY